MIKEPALALLELRSIARGIKTCDEVMKKADVQLLDARSLCPGKYMVLFAGAVSPVEESFRQGVAIGDDMMVDELFLPNAHPQLIPAMEACAVAPAVDALAVFETFTVASCILAADAAAKGANIFLIEMRLANGLGGKSFFTMTGEIAEIEAAADFAKKAIAHLAAMVAVEIIPRPHKDLILKVT
ncbi:MAG: BMC domain-containing protein [Nitrospinae bacterium]|nr:BMC domain-containing protein [Nitrospinota bacterium]